MARLRVGSKHKIKPGLLKVDVDCLECGETVLSLLWPVWMLGDYDERKAQRILNDCRSGMIPGNDRDHVCGESRLPVEEVLKVLGIVLRKV